jgi:Txe/YoeB family toxin of Txe-Axe toxin-antitoxin module
LLQLSAVVQVFTGLQNLILSHRFSLHFYFGAQSFHFALVQYQEKCFEPYTYNSINKEKLLGNMTIASNINPSEYIFVNSYNKKENRGSGYMYQRFDKNKKLIYQITAMDINWDAKKKHFVINNF